MLARAKIETGRPAILTEHGIYTNERRIEIMMADWLYDGDEFGLQLDRQRRDLRDLWIDAFMSYARACYGAADRIITLYGGNRRVQQLHGADPGKVSIVPNGIDVKHFAALPRARDPGRPTVALIGRVVRIKDIKTFVRACSILQRSLPALEALVIGPDDEEPDYAAECVALADYLGLGERMRFVGRVRIADYLPRIDVVTLTSISEGQPLTLLEAGASGVPCVATDVGACREIIEGSDREEPPLGPGGAIVPLAEPGAIAAALLRLLTDHDHYDRCAAAIRERIRRHYNKRELDAEYAAIYRGLGVGAPATTAARAG
jgi:glycosyltransferase involved in cell wall biosynthesis